MHFKTREREREREREMFLTNEKIRIDKKKMLENIITQEHIPCRRQL